MNQGGKYDSLIPEPDHPALTVESEDLMMITNISLRIKNSNEVRFSEKENNKEDRKSSYDAGIITDFKKVRRTKLEKHY